MAVLAIILAAAVPSYSHYLARQRLRHVAELLETHFKDMDGARKHYEAALQIDPNDDDAHSNLATLLKNHFRDEDAAASTGSSGRTAIGSRADPRRRCDLRR